MIKHILAAVALTLPLAGFAGTTGSSGTTTTNSGKTASAPTSKVDGTKHRSDKKTLKAYCETQVKQQGLKGAKAKSAIAACEKS